MHPNNLEENRGAWKKKKRELEGYAAGGCWHLGVRLGFVLGTSIDLLLGLEAKVTNMAEVWVNKSSAVMLHNTRT